MRRSISLFFLLANVSYAWWLLSSRKSEPEPPRPAAQSSNQPSNTNIPRSSSRGLAIVSPMGYTSSTPIPMQQKPNGGTVQRNNSSQRFSLDRSYSDQDPVVVRSFSGGCTSSFSPKGFSEASLQLRKKKPFEVGYRDVNDILSQPYYFVDKTPFIVRWLNDDSHFKVFLRPRKTGKSVVASMLGTFLNCLAEPSAGFRRLTTIYREQEYAGIVKGYANKYGVIWLDWANSGVFEASDRIEFEMALIRYMQKVFRDGTDALGLSWNDIKKSGPDDVDLDDLLNADHESAAVGILSALVHTISKISENLVVIIIDDLDEVYRKATEVGAYDIINEYLSEAFELTIKNCETFIWKIVAFGVHMLKDDGPFKKIRLNLERVQYSFLGSPDNYQHDFGFTEEELILALEEFPECKLSIADLEENYQIVSETAKTTLFHPYSTALAIKNGIVDEYWTRENPIQLEKHPFNRVERKFFGFGDFFTIANEPNLAAESWATTYLPISYCPDDKSVLNSSHVLAWLHEEGYASRKQLGSKEMNSHLKMASFSWFSCDTAIVPALQELRFGTEDYGYQRIIFALTQIIKIEHFYKGKPALESQQLLTKLVNQLAATIYPFLEFFKYDGKAYPVLKASYDLWIIIAFDLWSSKPFPIEQFTASVKMSKLVGDFTHDIALLSCGLEAGKTPRVVFTKLYSRSYMTRK